MSGPRDPNPRAPDPARDTDGRGSANVEATNDRVEDPNVEAVTEAFEAGRPRDVEREAPLDGASAGGEPRVEGDH